MNLKKLSEKFSEQDIEWRVQQSGLGKNHTPWALIIPYITNRAIMQRLDDVCGPDNWKNEFISSPCANGYLCGISIKLGDEWVTRWDGSEISGNGGIDQVKSTISNSMKRAGVQWGIGRYLYQFEATFADCEPCDYRSNAREGWTYQRCKQKNGPDYGIAWKPKPLPTWAIPVDDEKIKGFINGMAIASNMQELKKAYTYAYNCAVSEQDNELLDKFNAEKDKQIIRIEKETAERKAKASKEAEEYVRQSISVINDTTNESAANGQANLAIAKSNEILDASLQRKAILAINQAKDNKIKSLGAKNGN